jgi:hypothetical protein
MASFIIEAEFSGQWLPVPLHSPARYPSREQAETAGEVIYPDRACRVLESAEPPNATIRRVSAGGA